MDRDHGPFSSDDIRSRKGRLMGKLFGGRDRKTSNEQPDTNGDIDAFLHGTTVSASANSPSPSASSPVGSSSDSFKTTPPSKFVTPAGDTLQVSHASPPQLAKLDTRAATRYPNASHVSHASHGSYGSYGSDMVNTPATAYASNTSLQTLAGRRSYSPPRSFQSSATALVPRRPRKSGLTVRFTESYPEIIGEGGDESEIPAIEVSRRRLARNAQPAWPFPQQQQQPPPLQKPLQKPLQQPLQSLGAGASEPPSRPPRSPIQATPEHTYYPQQQQPPQRPFRPPEDDDDSFRPGPIRRTQTGFSSVTDDSPDGADEYDIPSASSSPERREAAPVVTPSIALPALQLPSTSFSPIMTREERRRSFIEVHGAEMLKAEREALHAHAEQDGVSPPSSPEAEDRHTPLQENRSPTTASSPPILPPPRHPDHRRPPRASDPPPLVTAAAVDHPPSAAVVAASASLAPAPALTSHSSNLSPTRSPTRSPNLSANPSPVPSPNPSLNLVAPVPPPKLSPKMPSPIITTTELPLRGGRVKQLAHDQNSPQPLSSPNSALHRAYNAFRTNAGGLLEGKERVETASATSPKPRTGLVDVVRAAADDAFNLFVERSRHLFELFRLHSETLRPLSSSSADELARAAVWWFIIGRMALENALRDRQTPDKRGSPVSRSNEFAMQQAYADLAKACWLVDDILPETLASRQSPVDTEVSQVCSSLISNIRKLSMSMKRNELLPPEDAFLPQTIDKSIWAKYPPVSSDITALLWGHWRSSLAAASPITPPMAILEGLPIADNAEDYVFSRVWADVYLMEQGRDSRQQQFHFPCLLSVVRPQKLPGLEIVLASQDGTVQLRVKGTKSEGPLWEDIKWLPNHSALEMRLPRGFLLVIQLAQQDYNLLWSMYDFSSKVHSQLFPRKDDRNSYPRQEEYPVFQTTVKAFQYFESGSQVTGSFPKDAVPECDVALFERYRLEKVAKGLRSFHRGFRLAVVSGTRTRTLYGVSHSYAPETPVQFSFLRGDQGDPALLLRFESSRSKGSMVLTFAHEDERIRLKNLLAGTALHRGERVVADVPISTYHISTAALVDANSTRPSSSSAEGSSPGGSNSLSVFKKLTLKRLRVINHDDEGDNNVAPTVLSEKLRAIFEFGDCTLADRINVAPGEFKIRLSTRDTTRLAILRLPQDDLTLAVSDVQVPREMSHELTAGLRTVRTTPTCRVMRLTNLADLHMVQQALTGYEVTFDGVAAAFAIARRRMVVPIHKKWEAGATRIQVVVHPDTKVTQLLVFFQDFHYGHSMSFVLKGTDVFESFTRTGGKFGLKFDDAKFPLPRMTSKAAPSTGGFASSFGASLSAANESRQSRDGGRPAIVGGETVGRASFDDDGAGGGPEYNEVAYVCLDMPDLPGEHDDITILFDKEADRDKLASCLPAPVRGARLPKMF